MVDDECYLNSNDFTLSYPLKNGSFYEIAKTVLTKTDEFYVRRKSFVISRFFKIHEMINFSRELNILLLLNHPSILKFIGYTLHLQGEPIIFTQFCSNGSLGRILKMKRNESQNEINDNKEEETNVANDENKEEESIDKNIDDDKNNEDDDENNEEEISDKNDKEEEEAHDENLMNHEVDDDDDSMYSDD